MFAADTALQILTRAASLEYRLADQLADTVAVQNLERIVLQNTLFEVDRQELGDIVARESQGHLRQVIGSEREELCNLGYLIGRNCRTRNLDHRTDHIVDPVVALGEDLFGRTVDDLLLVTELLVVAHQRNHDLDMYRNARCADIHRCLDNGTGLHLGDFGIGVAQTAAAVSQHRVEFGQRLDLLDDLLERDMHILSQFALLLLEVRNELVQRRIEQSHRNRIALHNLEQTFEVAALHREQLGQSHATAGLIVGQNHLANGLDTVALEEHVLGTAQADTLGAECEGLFCILRRIGIGTNLQYRIFRSQIHQFCEVAAQVGSLRCNLSEVNLSGRTVKRDPVALLDNRIADMDRTGLVVDLQLAGTRDAALAHTACNDSRMRGHTAALGQDTCRVEHTLQILGRGFDTHQNRLLSLFGEFLGILGEEYDRSGSGTRRGRKSLDQNLGILDGALVEYRVQQLVELGRFATQYGGLLVDQPLGQHVHCDLDHRGTGTLAVAALQHPQLAVLDRKLDILHVGEVLLQVVLYLVQLLVYLRHNLLQRRIFLGTLLFAYVLSLGPTFRTLDGDLLRRADTCNDILTLGVDQILAVEDIFTRSGIAREGNARSRVVAHVSEYHRLYVDGGTPLRRDVVQLAVEDRTLVHPRAEYGADSAPQLIPRRYGEVLAGLFLDGGLELDNQLLQVIGRQFGIVLDAAGLLHLVDNHLERILILLADRFHTQDDITVHLHETAVRVPCETRVAREFRNSLDSLVVQTEVEDRVHHTGHRSAGARTNRYEQRSHRVTELAAGQAFDTSDRLFDIRAQHLDDTILAMLIVFGADAGRNREPRRNGDTYLVHLCQVCPLAAQQFSHFAIAFGLFVAERIDAFYV